MFNELSKEVHYFIEKKEFLNVATCDFSGHPNVAPKFFVKAKSNCG